MMKFTVCAVSLLLALVAARQLQVEALDMKNLAKGFLNRYTSSNGFDQLNALVTSPFAAESRSAEAIFKEIEHFLAKPESKKARNAPLAEAAEQFLQLKRRRGGQVCGLDILKSTLALQESLNSGLAQPLSLDGASNTHRRQLLRTFRRVGRENARLCLERYQTEWAALTSSSDWLGGPDEEERVSQHLSIFQEDTNDLTCEKRFESIRPNVLFFECTLHAANAPFVHPDDLHHLRMALESIQRLRDDSQKTLSRFDADDKSFKPKSEKEINALLGEYLRQPCQRLMANEAGTRLLKGVQLFALMLGLPDDLFSHYNANTDQLVKWSGRLVLCERLLEHTNIEELARALAGSARRR